MVKFVGKRLLSYSLLLFLATSLAYLIASVALDPTANIDLTNPNLNRQAVENTLNEYNINPAESPFVRYGRWIDSVVTDWDWGQTPRGESVNDLVGTRIWVSVRLVTIGTIVGIVFGVAIGAWSAVRQYSKADHVVSIASLIFISTPVLVFAVVLQILAIEFNQATGWRFFEFIGETGRSGDYFGAAFMDRLQHLLLPTLSLSVFSIAVYSRYQRNLMLDTLGADYVRTARAKGLPKRVAIRRHALRNAIIPMATFFAFDVATIFVGAAVTETLFGWHGMGEYLVQSIQRQDINGITATAAFSGLCVLAGATLSDILIAAVDPRVRT
ncbi:MAG: ABC transporter permease [Acidimicrobiales bacterium]|nr:ABC transporter permease [Acidimicrobiales bacterium]